MTIDPDARRRAYDRVSRGMTYREVKDILGDAEKCVSFGAGSIKPGSQGAAYFTYTYRWEDFENTFDVRFEGFGGD
jgi:hypothetical protein